MSVAPRSLWGCLCQIWFTYQNNHLQACGGITGGAGGICQPSEHLLVIPVRAGSETIPGSVMFGGNRAALSEFQPWGSNWGRRKVPHTDTAGKHPSFGLRPRWWEAGAARLWAAGDGQLSWGCPCPGRDGSGQPEQPFASSLGKSPMQGCVSTGREHIWAPQSPSQWGDVVVGRAGGWSWGSTAAGALCNRKLPAGDPSRAALVADLIIQTILFCFSK